jgi:hypothetical protein
MKRIKCLSAIISLIMMDCGGFVHQERLVGNYYLIAIDSEGDMRISYRIGESSFLGAIRATVFAVGYDSNFIIVKQHPSASFGKIDRTKIDYYIVPAQDISKYDVVIGPLDQNSFIQKRRELKIPESLTFTKVFRDLE